MSYDLKLFFTLMMNLFSLSWHLTDAVEGDMTGTDRYLDQLLPLVCPFLLQLLTVYVNHRYFPRHILFTEPFMYHDLSKEKYPSSCKCIMLCEEGIMIIRLLREFNEGLFG